jgi:lysophospholipase L1-like esterase
MRRLKSMFAAGAATLLAAAAPLSEHWVGAFGNVPIGYEPNIRDALGAPLRDQTVRQSLRVASAGTTIRVRLTNELGTTALRIGRATFAQVDSSGRVVAGSMMPLTFNGERDAVIAAGAPLIADPLAVRVAPGSNYVISIYLPDSSTPAAHAQMADIAPGDQTGAATLHDSVRRRVPTIVSRVDVARPGDAYTLLTLGDSITEGAASTPGAYMSWPDQLARLLAAAPRTRCWSIVNAGISGNRLLHDGRGPNALARFDRDVLSVPGVRTIVLLEGINDIGARAQAEHSDQAVTAAAIIGTYREMIARAHAKGIRVIGGTLLPFEGAVYFTAAGEAKRQTVNAWIRSAGAFDGVIDFDVAMRDPAQPAHMSEAAGSTDNLHPHDAGYAIMARTASAMLMHDRCPGA